MPYTDSSLIPHFSGIESPVHRLQTHPTFISDSPHPQTPLHPISPALPGQCSSSVPPPPSRGALLPALSLLLSARSPRPSCAVCSPQWPDPTSSDLRQPTSHPTQLAFGTFYPADRHRIIFYDQQLTRYVAQQATRRSGPPRTKARPCPSTVSTPCPPLDDQSLRLCSRWKGKSH